jgi:hypothetical protein
VGKIERAIEDYEKAEKEYEEWAKNGFKKDLPKIIRPIDELIIIKHRGLSSRYKSRCRHSARLF